MIASGNADGSARIYTVSQEGNKFVFRNPKIFAAHQGGVSAITFKTPNLLLTGGKCDYKVKEWKL